MVCIFSSCSIIQNDWPKHSTELFLLLSGVIFSIALTPFSMINISDI